MSITNRIYIVLLVFGSILPFTALAQSFTWAKGGQLGSDSRMNELATDQWGNIYCTGYFSGSFQWDQVSFQTNGGRDAFIAKFDPAGNLVWAKQIGAGGADEGWGIAADSLGNVYAAGVFSNTVSFGSSSVSSKGGTDTYLMKMDSSGALIWTKTFGSIYPERLQRLVIRSNGDVYLAGVFSFISGPPWIFETISFDNITLTSNGSGDIFWACLKPDGTVKWAKNGGGIRSELLSSLAVDANDNLLISGSFDAPSATFGGFTIPNAGFDDAFIVKIDTGGSVLQVSYGGSTNPDWGVTAAIYDTSTHYLAGDYSGICHFGTTSLPSNGQFQIFLVRYRSNGNQVWAKQFGGDSWDFVNGLKADTEGNLYLSGLFMEKAFFGSDTLISAGAEDIFVAKIDSNGNVLKAISAGGTANDGATTMAYDASTASLVIAGNTSQNASFGPHTLSGKTHFLTRLGDLTHTENIISDNDEVKVFPNPASEFIHLTYDKSYRYYRLINVLGKAVKANSLPATGAATIEVSDLPGGVYWLQVQGLEMSVTRMISITN